MNEEKMEHAFAEAFDESLLFHGFADYGRDYDVYVQTYGKQPQMLRYRFEYCVRATIVTALNHDQWSHSLGDELIDYDAWRRSDAPSGYVWGVKSGTLYPGMELMSQSDETREWSARLGLPFHEVSIGTNVHQVSLVFADLHVSAVPPGATPFVVPEAQAPQPPPPSRARRRLP